MLKALSQTGSTHFFCRDSGWKILVRQQNETYKMEKTKQTQRKAEVRVCLEAGTGVRFRLGCGLCGLCVITQGGSPRRRYHPRPCQESPEFVSASCTRCVDGKDLRQTRRKSSQPDMSDTAASPTRSGSARTPVWKERKALQTNTAANTPTSFIFIVLIIKSRCFPPSLIV